MSIYWTKTAEIYPDAGYEDAFTAFDPEVRFPRFHLKEGDEPIGCVSRIPHGPRRDFWSWSMTVSLAGPAYAQPTNGVEAKRGDAARRMIEVYRHYLSNRPPGSYTMRGHE